MAGSNTEDAAELRRLVADTPDGLARASARIRLAVALRRIGCRSEALAAARLAADQFGRLDKAAAEARALLLVGELLNDLHRYDEAALRLGEARHALEVTQARASLVTRCERLLGDVARRRGRLEEAERWLASAYDGYVEQGSLLAAAGCDHDLGVLRHGLADPQGAIAILRAARSALLDLRDREGVASCGFNLGVALHDAGAHDDAIDHYQHARSIFEAVGRLEDAAGCDQNLAAVFFAIGRDEEARQRLLVAQDAYRKLGLMRRVAECDADLAQVLRRSGRADAASAYLARARSAGVEDPADASASA
jgi:tetratricopeptide (TPR) repeat protein